jgi:very-short-patch-repair endonuclease
MTKVFNRKKETKRRKALRRNMPEAEIILWSKLKGKQIYGYKFRRQYSVGTYVVDFYCPKLKLAIEVDGISHLQPGSETRDNERQKYIETYGIRFLRYINTDIYENLEGVIEQIGETIQELEGKRNILNSSLEKGE